MAPDFGDPHAPQPPSILSAPQRRGPRSGAARRSAEHCHHRSDRRQDRLDRCRLCGRPARDRGGLVRARAPAAPAGRHRRGAGPCQDAARAGGLGAGAEPEGSRARHRLRCRPAGRAPVGQPRAQPGQPAQDARRGGGRGGAHPRAARRRRQPHADRRRRGHGLWLHAAGRSGRERGTAPDAGPARRRRRPREPGRHRGLCRPGRRAAPVREGPRAGGRAPGLRAFPRHARHGPGQCLCGLADRHHALRCLPGRHRRLPARPGRQRQRCHRRPGLHARAHGRGHGPRRPRAAGAAPARARAGWPARRCTAHCGRRAFRAIFLPLRSPWRPRALDILTVLPR